MIYDAPFSKAAYGRGIGVSREPRSPDFAAARQMLVLASFENDLGWAPSLDGRASFARTSLT
jgi:hypothetical protein